MDEPRHQGLEEYVTNSDAKHHEFKDFPPSDDADIKQEQSSPSRPEENVFRENELLDTDENGKVNWQPDEDEKNCDGDEEMDEDEPGLEQSDEEGHFSPDEDQEPNGKKAFNAYVRKMCKDKLELQIPFTQQPPDQVQDVFNLITEKYPEFGPDEVRKKVRLFLKSRRSAMRRQPLKSHGDDPTDETQTFNTYVRLTCKEHLDCQIPITLQPEEKVQQVIEMILVKFPDCDEKAARKRVRIFLKNSRKEKKNRKGTPDGQPAKKRLKKEDRLPPSPWAVLSLSEFLHYKCPICEYISKEEGAFLQHAYEEHKESVVYLCTLSLDVTQEGPEEPFEVNLSWNANAIDVGTIKEESKDLAGKGGYLDEKPDVCKVEVKEGKSDDDNDGFQDSFQDDYLGGVDDSKVESSGEENDPEKPNETQSLDFKCDHCPKAFSSNIGLLTHVKKAHNLPPQEHRCNECDKTYASNGKLKEHIKRVHLKEKPFQCDQCSSAFADKHSLVEHIECIHEGVYKYFCDKCPKKFKSKKQLRQHVAGVHHKVRSEPLMCDQCDKHFLSPRYLKVHKQYRHENIRTFQCEKCPVHFRSPVGLKRHAATVHGEGTVQCKECDKKFYIQNELKRHMAQAHGGERKYPCDQCTKGFLCPSDLKRHKMTIHDGIKPEVCDICHKTFSWRGNLTAHKKKVHKVF